MTSILGRIDEVLAASRIQELDLIIETLFGNPPPLAPEFPPSNDDADLFDPDPGEWNSAYLPSKKVGCGFSSWNDSPVCHINDAVQHPTLSLASKISFLRSFAPHYPRRGLSNQVSRYRDQCCLAIAHGIEPLRWDVWLYLDMHGEEGLQP